ncbi:hypothetical protein AVEN_156798-1, partial [Araneus ventricosus]
MLPSGTAFALDASSGPNKKMILISLKSHPTFQKRIHDVDYSHHKWNICAYFKVIANLIVIGFDGR